MALDFHISSSEKEFQKGNKEWKYGIELKEHELLIGRRRKDFEQGAQTRKITSFFDDATFYGNEIKVFIQEAEKIKENISNEPERTEIDKIISVFKEASEFNRFVFVLCD
ncbi:hypothetical protein [Rubellicoccus peritrichatus]|uniref:Uncharacterized protein n=1 Tax=Rubellicoccus peritrichatus TaxID=3080537 RepID=A0AAQ3LBU1_9BACT|nr:hypothetical protein [Puniceicoccus sp. CR14]WOO41664.1 hypothetical protein RZN69_01090 [Puniceicoccus sp. CR14]